MIIIIIMKRPRENFYFIFLMMMRHGRKFYLVSNRRLHLGCTPFFLLSSIFLRKISYFRSYGDKFWYHHVKKTFVIICVYSMKIDKNDVKFVIFRLWNDSETFHWCLEYPKDIVLLEVKILNSVFHVLRGL